MKKARLLNSLTLVTVLLTPFTTEANDLPFNTRISDELQRTGERFAVVMQNDSEQNVSAHIWGDPSFNLYDPGSLRGIISGGRKSYNYKIFYKKFLGIPQMVQESSEAFDSFDGFTMRKDSFANIPGMLINPGVYVTINTPLRPRCTNIYPDREDKPDVLAHFDLTRIGGNLSHLYPSILYIKVAANGLSCTAEFKDPGDVNWIDDGPTLPGSTSQLSGAITVRDNAKARIDQLVAARDASDYTPVVSGNTPEGALAVRTQALGWIQQQVENQKGDTYTPITTGSRDGALAVRDQAAQLLQQRTNPTASSQ